MLDAENEQQQAQRVIEKNPHIGVIQEKLEVSATLFFLRRLPRKIVVIILRGGPERFPTLRSTVPPLQDTYQPGLSFRPDQSPSRTIRAANLHQARRYNTVSKND